MLGQARDKGVTTVLMQGGLNPKLPFQYYLDLVSESRRRYPDIHPHFFSAPEIMKMSEVSGLSVHGVLAQLKDAGLQTIPGGGSEILSNRVKHKISRLFPKGKVDDWTLVHSEAHKLGYKTTATMMYGHLEDDEDVVEHLDHIREVQDENGGFTAFIPWSYKKDNTALGKRVKQEAGPNAYLRIMAVSRIYLDNFPHIQASWFSEGKKTGQVALHFGGDDFGGTLFDENVMQEAGFYNRTTVDEVCHIIRGRRLHPRPAQHPLRHRQTLVEAPLQSFTNSGGACVPTPVIPRGARNLRSRTLWLLSHVVRACPQQGPIRMGPELSLSPM